MPANVPKQCNLGQFFSNRPITATDNNYLLCDGFLLSQLKLGLFSIGGTLDVTALEILYGGTKVDEEFVSLLKKFFGTNVVEIFRTKYPGE